ncbi:MAG TPA: chromosome partitioning protein ParB, partial [Exilispira sp.]|nr:chromosome partitioning protein ParB [Exilispira sp.]
KYSKGENTTKKEVKSKESQTDPFIKEIEEKLSYKFDTKVKINGSLEKGKIVIEYFNRDQLEKLLS